MGLDVPLEAVDAGGDGLFVVKVDGLLDAANDAIVVAIEAIGRVAVQGEDLKAGRMSRDVELAELGAADWGAGCVGRIGGIDEDGAGGNEERGDALGRAEGDEVGSFGCVGNVIGLPNPQGAGKGGLGAEGGRVEQGEDGDEGGHEA